MSFQESEPRTGSRIPVALAANAVVNSGEIAVLNASGWGAPGSAATGLRALGVWFVNDPGGQVDNTGGANGAKSATVSLSDCPEGLRRFPLKNSATDPVTTADVGSICYIESANTVAQTDNGGTLSRAGKVWGLTEDGLVLVEFDRDFDQADIATLQAAIDDIQAVPSVAAAGVTAAMTGGAITVTGLTLSASDYIGYSRTTLGGTAGHVSVTARTNASGTGSFTLTSSSNTETSTFTWWIVRPAA